MDSFSSRGMAVVAGVAVVHESPNVVVLVAHLGPAMAREAGERSEARRVGVAVGAGAPLVAVLARKDRKEETVVLAKTGALPTLDGVTGLAIAIESSRDMVGFSGVLKVLPVTAEAIGRRVGERALMAVSATQIPMSTDPGPVTFRVTG